MVDSAPFHSVVMARHNLITLKAIVSEESFMADFRTVSSCTVSALPVGPNLNRIPVRQVFTHGNYLPYEPHLQ